MSSLKFWKEGILMIRFPNKRLTALLCLLCLGIFACSSVFASEITFSGGFTRVSLRDGDRRVELSDNANAATDNVSIRADRILLYGTDYRYVECTGNIQAEEKEHSLIITASNIFFDREEETLLSDGWIEIKDTGHEAKLSGSWFEYSMKTSIILLQMQAGISKVTEKGLLTCSADSIEYNSDEQTLSLKGNAKVSWGSDNYRASYITVNIDTEDVTLHGMISGEVNG